MNQKEVYIKINGEKFKQDAEAKLDEKGMSLRKMADTIRVSNAWFSGICKRNSTKRDMFKAACNLLGLNMYDYMASSAELASKKSEIPDKSMSINFDKFEFDARAYCKRKKISLYDLGCKCDYKSHSWLQDSKRRGYIRSNLFYKVCNVINKDPERYKAYADSNSNQAENINMEENKSDFEGIINSLKIIAMEEIDGNHNRSAILDTLEKTINKLDVITDELEKLINENNVNKPNFKEM